MSRDRECTKEELSHQLVEYLKLTRRPNLSAGARTVLQLQIAHIENLLRGKHGRGVEGVGGYGQSAEALLRRFACAS